MPIDPNVLAEHIAESGPFMFHVTSAGAAEAMFKEGLLPDADVESTEARGFFESRAWHVYLLTLEDAPLVPVNGEWAMLRVDLRSLDPGRFDTDEDLARSADMSGAPWVSTPTPVREMGSDGTTELDGQSGRLARWAEEDSEFDDPAVVEKSLNGGRIAYRGSIGPEALEVAHEASEGGARFLAVACRVLEIEPSELGDPPEVGYQDTEVERAYRLAESLLEAALGRPASENLREPYASRGLGDELRREGRDLNRTDDWHRGTVVLAAASLAEACEELDSLPSWPHNRRAFFEICDSAGELLAVMRDCVGRLRAVDAAREGLGAIREST